MSTDGGGLDVRLVYPSAQQRGRVARMAGAHHDQVEGFGGWGAELEAASQQTRPPAQVSRS